MGFFWEQNYGNMNGGFKERAARNGTPTYVYDANGNLTQDKNKGLTITYNYLNLPQTITFDGTQGNAGGTIDFIYDATGKKWRKTVTPTRQCGQVRDYIDGVEYTSTLCGLILSSITPDIIHFSDGYIQRDPSTDGNYSWMGWVYKYALTDHLGNTRVVFSDKNDDGVVGVTDMEQINNYYPFGLNMDGPWNGASGQYKFQYNQKEWNGDLGLNLNDYGARFYDPTIGRWGGVDKMSEKFRGLNPYSYVANTPINGIDPDGNTIWIYYTDENGNEANIKYEAKMDYKGKNDFVSKSVKYLNALNSTKKGAVVLSDLIKSNNNFDFKNSKSAAGDRTLQFDPTDEKYKNGGGEIKAAALMNPEMSDAENFNSTGHELFHAYQREKGSSFGIETEVEAYLFGAVMNGESDNYNTGLSFENLSQFGQLYGKAMSNLLYNGYDQNSFEQAANNFINGSIQNQDGVYNGISRKKGFKLLIDKFIPIK